MWFLFLFYLSVTVNAKTFDLGEVVLDRPYAAMAGPNRYLFLPLSDSKEIEEFWLLGSKIEITDKKSGASAAQALCHSRLGLVNVEGLDFSKLKIVKDDPKFDMEVFMSLSQGQFEVNFPQGFGLRFETSPQRQLIFGAQFQKAESDPAKKKEINSKVSLRYATASEAQAQGLKPLYSFIMPVTSDGRSRHWHVPPGEHLYKTKMRLRSAQKKILKAHYIRTHLHAYATSIELYDMTLKQTVWIGRAETDRTNGSLARTDFYSASEGLSLYAGHIYEVRALYNNPLKLPVDAMAFLNLYLDSPSAMADFRLGLKSE